MRENGVTFRGHLGQSGILCAAVLFLTGLWNAPAWPQSDSQDPGIERGHKQFEQSCGFWHGPDATGARGPDLLRSPLWAPDSNGGKLGQVIHIRRRDKGCPRKPMADQ